MNEEFKEEYWENALGVLEREERLARKRRFLPWIFFASIVGTQVLATFLSWYLPTSDASLAASQIDILQQNTRDTQSAVQSIPTLEDSASTTNITQAAQTQNKHKTLGDIAHQEGVSKNSLALNNDKRQAQMSQSPGSNSNEIETEIKLADTLVNKPTGLIDVVNSADKQHEISAISTITIDRVKESMLAVPDDNITFTEQRNTQGESLNPYNAEKIDSRSLMLKMTPKTAQLKTGVQAQIKFRGFEYHAPFPFKVNNVYALVGNSFLTGFGSRKSELAFNPEIGFGYERVLAKRWSANVALSYFQIGGITHAAEFSETELGFGFNRTVTTIETSKLHFAYLPIMGNWDFNKRNALSLGIGVSFLINGLSEVTVTEISDFSENQISQTTDWGYTQGYRAFNSSLLAGYEFRLTSRITFGVLYQYGLREITKSNIYGHEFQDRNSRLRALIKYSIR